MTNKKYTIKVSLSEEDETVAVDVMLDMEVIDD